MSMRVASLASGSSGNSYYLECSEGAIVVDAGLSGKSLLRHLELAGGDPAKVAGVIVTHDHADHASGAGILFRKFGWRLWMTKGTRDAAGSMGKVRVETIAPGSGLRAGGFAIDFIATPHDGAEPVIVAAERNGVRCGVFTDLGHPFGGLADHLARLDFAFLESNYDPGLLAANRRYPAGLKRRISGPAGHLSNIEAARLVAGVPGTRLRRVVLSHLSEENNRPELARNCFRKMVGERARELDMKIGVAERHCPMRLCPVR
ncbi:MAG: MBL fold metallo-hydrolase [Planctomycetota bacterium]|jgi:phosphoribosyl 1,2-cyclic phosphodiesterase|nr:MBL fold metallo-hydrolase [Planctomycetota bacterium]